MCLSPINIPNQSKYVSLRHKDRFIYQVPCGRCAECQQTLSNQWYYRSWYEYNDIATVGGYVLFDTLTYRNEDLPHLSQFWSVLDKKDDFPCFNHLHIRNFLQLLRTRLIRLGYSKNAFRYFLATEYGTKSGHTHRPHIHIMLYVYDKIDPLFLSRLIAKLWKFGRTDGLPYKSKKYVMEHNVISADSSLGSKLRTCHYITKYIQKSCEFQAQLDKRIGKVMLALANIADPVTPEKWLESELARRERLKLLRFVNQFHRQSQHFGESALADLDLNQLYKDGCLYMPDSQGLKIPVPLPMYYKRKLFYEQVEFNGSRYWQLTDLGLEYNNVRSTFTLDLLRRRYEAVKLQYHLDDIDSFELARYVYNERGRIIADLPESRLVDRINDIDYINYSTCSDKLQFGSRGLVTEWLGDSQQGYLSSHLTNSISLSVFIEKYCYFDARLESQLDKVNSLQSKLNVSRQSAFAKRQHLENVYKQFV